MQRTHRIHCKVNLWPYAVALLSLYVLSSPASAQNIRQLVFEDDAQSDETSTPQEKVRIQVRRSEAAVALKSTTAEFASQQPLNTGSTNPIQSVSASPFVQNVSRHDASLRIIVGQGRLLTLKDELSHNGIPAFVAVGDPSVVEFEVIGPRQIRIIGLAIGVTDLAVTTSEDHTFSIEVQVAADLELLSLRLQAAFPTAHLKLSSLRNNVVVEGQARDVVQADRILRTIDTYLSAIHSSQQKQINYGTVPQIPESQERRGRNGRLNNREQHVERIALPELAPKPTTRASLQKPQVINLLRIPGAQQVLLKVQIAELNRTALRQLGVSMASTGNNAAFGSNVTGAANAVNNGMLTFTNAATTIAGMHFAADQTIQYWVDALQANGVLKILAEPNLVAKNGHRASFLAGGEFPVPVPQVNSSGGTTTTVEYREFGVRLNFTPQILEDGVIELSVEPEVSSIDQSLATSLVANGSPVPGLNTRKASTTVDLREGETLTIAGLMQLEMNGSARQIPGLGNLPVLGPFFRNNSSRRFEKELVVLVTPHLVDSVRKQDVPPLPGSQVNEPNDSELYFMGRIESRVGRDYRSTTEWDTPLELIQLERRHVQGPVGFSD